MSQYTLASLGETTSTTSAFSPSSTSYSIFITATETQKIRKEVFGNDVLLVYIY